MIARLEERVQASSLDMSQMPYFERRDVTGN